MTTHTKHCGICGRVYARHPNEAPSRFNQRKTCSSRCGSILGRKASRAHPQKPVPEPTDEELDRRAEIILARLGEWRAA